MLLVPFALKTSDLSSSYLFFLYLEGSMRCLPVCFVGQENVGYSGEGDIYHFSHIFWLVISTVSGVPVQTV